MEKHLKVNTSLLDMTSTRPEAIEAYDVVRINCAFCLTTAKTRQLLSHGKVSINTANICDIGLVEHEHVEVVTINGVKKTTSEFAAPSVPTVLVINGAMIIDDSPKKKMDQYLKVVVNGVVMHPKSFDLSNFIINGIFIPYPDGATLILQALELTNSFLRSAVPGTTYFVQGMPADLNGLAGGINNPLNLLKEIGLKAMEPLDLDLLKSKNIRFYTGWVTTLEENAGELLKMIDGSMGTTIIPAGYKTMPGGKLDMLSIRRFGKRLFVEGNLEVHEKALEALNTVEDMIVTGDVILADPVADVFFGKCQKYGDLTVYQGEWMEIKENEFSVSRELLEGCQNGATLCIKDSTVQIDSDLPADLLTEKIHQIIIRDSVLTMSLHQQNVINKLLRSNDSHIKIREHEEVKQPEPEPVKEDVIETKINCSYYKL